MSLNLVLLRFINAAFFFMQQRSNVISQLYNTWLHFAINICMYVCVNMYVCMCVFMCVNI